MAASCWVISLLLLVSGFPCLSLGSDARFTVFRAELGNTPDMGNVSEITKDLYISGGENDGISHGMVLDVYREKIVSAAKVGQEYTISILVGRVKVISLFKNIAITRIISLASPEDTPLLQYQTVMQGDYTVPRPIRQGEIQENMSSEAETMPVEKEQLPFDADSGLVFPSEVLFGFDGWQLKPEAMEALGLVHDTISKEKDKEILIMGHTCNLGPAAYNLELSKKRAQSVSDFLMNTKGIPQDRIRIDYHGEKFPVASNATDAGRAKNRRVEIFFQPHNSTSS